jgi:hypothetical protein
MRLGLLIAIGVMAPLLLGCGPIVMLPGGALSGDVTPNPTNWEFTEEVDTFQLETRPSDPYSVNIWAIAIEDTMYIVAGGGPDTTWASHIKDDPQVRLRVGDALYELTAVESNTNSERDLFLAAAKKKYDFDPDGEDTAKAVLYRLKPR